jgi:hypothetical protein
MSRIEYKYLLPRSIIDDLRKKIATYVELDPYSAIRPNHYYTVHSIYFDTAQLDLYYEKLSGLKRRKKLRVRGYNEQTKDSYVFLEIKRKTGMAVSKLRAKVVYENLDSLMQSNDIDTYVSKNGDYHSYENAQRFLYHIHKLHLKPIVLISYEREAYFYKFYHGWRITIDQNLRSCMTNSFHSLFDYNNTVESLPKHYIFEIKGSGVMPEWLRYIIGTLNLKLAALSKYTMSIDSHNGFMINKVSYSRINLTPINLIKYRKK